MKQAPKKEEPVDYQIGFIPFFHTKIDLSERPLIPRPETEYWTEQFVIELKTKVANKALQIADVFAGSGCIGIAILKNTKNTKVDFFEIDKTFVNQIKKNLKINKIPTYRYKVIQSNILNKAKTKYDYILGNPPYLDPRNTKRIQKSVLNYEPEKALFGGKGGLEIIKKFVKETKKYLKPGGELWFEFDSPQKKEIKNILKKEGYKSIKILKDQYNRSRYASAVVF